MVFLEDWYRALLLAHLLATILLVGSMTHNTFIVGGYLRGKFGRKQREKYYARMAMGSYILVYVIGAIIYPAYRVHIRHHYFDPQLPWATGLFEVKEHWGAVGLVFIVVYYWLRRNFEPDAEKEKLVFYIPLCLILNVILWYKVIVGGYLTLLKGSWS